MLELLRKDAVEYLQQNMSKFLKRGEQMLICFPNPEPGSLGAALCDAVTRCGGIPELWGPDLRWKGLLRQAFSRKIKAIAGPPLILLGLTKLARAMGTPLSVRNVLLTGYPATDWMLEGIISGLDCQIWGCFGPGLDGVVSGFSCGKSKGVHIRNDIFRFEIVDQDGRPLPEGMMGNIALTPVSGRGERRIMREHARIDSTACTCGCTSPRLMDIGPGYGVDTTLYTLAESFHKWTSILDCRLEKGEYGLELELVIFPGEQLPKLPTCAKRVIRNWDPEIDEPLAVIPDWRKLYISQENH
jgi:hypothetical protein